MGYYLSQIFEIFFFPPGIFIVLLVLSVVFVNNLKRLKILLLMQILLIYILSIPLTSQTLFSQLETIAALSEAQISTNKKMNKVDVIIVLAGGISAYKNEYHGPAIGYFTQERLHYAAWLQKRTGLPVIVTGGIERGGASEAQLMKQTLQNEYGIKSLIWVEQESKNTYENALFSSKIMKKHGYQNYYLVTSAFHMPRALDVFQKQNHKAMPAPMGFYVNQNKFELDQLKPNSKSLWTNYLALHEIVGRYWYRLYYG